jgi:soluble lytic murein transglycosylase-like protein
MTRSTALTFSLVVLTWSIFAPTALGRSKAEAVHDPDLIVLLAKTMAVEVDESDHYDAEVWLMSTEPKLVRFIGAADERMQVLQNVYREANRHDIDPDLVLALIQVESAFDRFAVSSAGAQGLMQVMPFWRHEIGRPQDNLTSIETNVRYGTAILAHYIGVSSGDLIDALARYNGSRGRLQYPERVVRTFLRTWQTQSTDELPALREGCLAYSLAACAPITFRR